MSPPTRTALVFVLAVVGILIADELIDAFAPDRAFYVEANIAAYGLISAVTAWTLYMLVVHTRTDDQQRYQSLIHHALYISGCGILVLDAQFKVIWANQVLEHYLGIPRREMMGQDMRQLARDRIQHTFEEPEDFLRKVLATYGKSRIESFECHIPGSAGREERWLQHWSQSIQAGPYAGGRIEHYLDITERKRAQEKARQHEADLAHIARVSSVGEMAAGLAHEINQPLTAIVAYTAGCLRRLSTEPGGHGDLVAMMEKVKAQAERAGEVVRHMRGFVRKEVLNPCAVDINELVREAVSFVEPDARRKDIRIGLKLADALAPVLAERIQIQQVVVNLAKNGLEAIDEAGAALRELTIETSMVGREAVEVAVSDTGGGLDAAMLDQLFTAFFTTKPEGLGIGLSISRSIIDTHGGRLWGAQRADGGTVFRFTLPIIKGAHYEDAA